MTPIVEMGGLVPPSTQIDVDIQTNVQLTNKQHDLAVEAKAAFIGAGMMTAQWIAKMCDLRNSLVPTGANGNSPKKANNWKQVCADVFQGLDHNHANGMIRGWEALWGANSNRPNGPIRNSTPDLEEIKAEPILRTISASATFYRELGKVKAEVRPVLVEQLRKGEMSCTSMAVQKAAKKEERALKTVGFTDVQPSAPKAAPKPISPAALPIAPPAEGNTYSLAKWRSVPEVAEELEWAQKHLEKMRKAAVSYRNYCKQLEDRMAQGIAQNRNYPAIMTVYSTIWKENGFDFDAALQDVTVEMSEANRLWGLAMPLCHGAAKITK